MIINYWDCPFRNYEEFWDGETETRCYGCKHPLGNYACDLDNKYCDDTAECKLLDMKQGEE